MAQRPMSRPAKKATRVLAVDHSGATTQYTAVWATVYTAETSTVPR